MSNLHQIQLQYDAHQDRGLLHILTQDNQEFRFWVTRRYVALLWPKLHKMLKLSTQAAGHTNPHTRDTILALQHEQMVNKADFTAPYQPASTAVTTPLGTEPILLARVEIKPKDSGRIVLCLHPLTGSGVEIALNLPLLHSFGKLMSDLGKASEWGINCNLTSPVLIAPAPERIN